MKLFNEISNYIPFNEQEEKDQELILKCLKEEKEVFTRNNSLAHMTASAWIVNKERTKVLMAFHNIYRSWAWLGGHADGEENLLKVAMREALEESGIRRVRPVNDSIFSLEALHVSGHIKNGAYVSSHLHLNITYLLEADETDRVRIKKDENSGVSWFTLDEAVQASSESWMREHIYAKLNAKLKALPPVYYREEKGYT